jgi:NADH:ubiquinone oxidoreductase subunit 2 (subunit N)
MEETLAHIARDAAWFVVVVLVFSVIGVIATIRWIIGLVTNTEHAVESGVKSVEDKFSGDR